MFDVPDPKDINARFVYNFFVPNEGTDTSGMPRFQGIVTSKTQREINDRTMEALLPRYVEIDFTPVHAGHDNINDLPLQNVLSENKSFVQSEETITTPGDVSCTYSDPNIKPRISKKANLLAKILGETSNMTMKKVDAINEFDDSMDTQTLQDLISLEDKSGVISVNEVGDLSEDPIFTKASLSSIDMILDRRTMRPLFVGDYSSSSFTKSELDDMSENDALFYLPVASDDSGERSDEPDLNVLYSEKVENSSDSVNSMTVGYIVEREEERFDGTTEDRKKYYIDGVDSTRFLDTRIRYGSTYKYSLRTVALVEMTIESNGEQNLEPGFYRVLSLISSKPSPPKIVPAIERVPPLEPDGVFYRFNYDDGAGLFIRWQIPAGKQRDVKYFQIFRRKSINEPFTCIAEIDFNDATQKLPRYEKVSDDRIIKEKAPMTSFLDTKFNRSSSYIYAVCAVDAHGLSSGYSAQSLVSFDTISNSIQLKNISRASAPKQYPNFFIDPDLDTNIAVDSLTQDSMMVSKKFKINVYFDPDTVEFTKKDGTKLPLLATDNSQGVYKLHLLNIDRQKSQVLEIKIDDLR